MAFIPITTEEITTGKPVANTTQTKIKDNFDNHEDRITSLESGGAVEYQPIILSVQGYYGDLGTYTGAVITTIGFDIIVTGIRLIIKEAGSGGTTACDLQVMPPAGSFATVLTTQPSVASSAGNYATSSNGVLDPAETTILAGSIVRLDITSSQSGGKGFIVRIDYVKV